eukprot:5383312-Alexandrium_andersonii.AAC.1
MGLQGASVRGCRWAGRPKRAPQARRHASGSLGGGKDLNCARGAQGSWLGQRSNLLRTKDAAHDVLLRASRSTAGTVR